MWAESLTAASQISPFQKMLDLKKRRRKNEVSVSGLITAFLQTEPRLHDSRPAFLLRIIILPEALVSRNLGERQRKQKPLNACSICAASSKETEVISNVTGTTTLHFCGVSPQGVLAATRGMGRVQLSFCALRFARQTVPKSQRRQSQSNSWCSWQANLPLSPCWLALPAPQSSAENHLCT